MYVFLDLPTYFFNYDVCILLFGQLENEVASLKKRLDELRKAKNTTILKREREVLEVGAPFGRRWESV